MLTSLQTAVSGMNSNGTYISVIADNIANLNTVGYKKSTLVFGDILSGSMTGVSGSAQVGRGSLVQKISPLFTQGALENTENALDLAIDGNGFFIVKEVNGGSYYTRSGRFDIDELGFIVNASGLRLQGYQADAAGNIIGITSDLQLIATQTPARITSNAMAFVNLDGKENVPPGAFTLDSNGDGVANDVTNYNHSTTLRVYDSQGGEQALTLYYVKIADNEWHVHYVYKDPADPTQLVEATDVTGMTVAFAHLQFDTNGALITPVGGIDPHFVFTGGVVQPQRITFDHTRDMQNKSAFAVLDNDQDGYASGSLDRLAIDKEGYMTGYFSNGEARLVGQIALAKFIATTELIKLGWNLYGESTKSGQPIVSTPGTSGLGDIVPNTVELSNVDLAQEFVNLITAQRAFQANSRIVTTTDELMAEVVNLKR